MITVVHIHVGDEYPRYFWDTIRQTRRFFSGNVVVVVAGRLVGHPEGKRLGCTMLDYTPLLSSRKLSQLNEIQILQKIGNDMFWHRALLRLFLLEEVMRTLSLHHVVHLENDVAIYVDPDEHEQIFTRLYCGCVAINPIGPGHAAAAYLYVDSTNALEFVNEGQLELLRLGEEHIKSIMGSDMVNEMVLLKILQDRHPNRIAYLPVLPVGLNSDGFKEMSSLFDGASWGQFVGGTPKRPVPGAAYEHHWVGREIRARKYLVCWKKDTYGRMCPFVCETGGGEQLFQLNNLHIHCKQVRRYTLPKPWYYPGRNCFGVVSYKGRPE